MILMFPTSMRLRNWTKTLGTPGPTTSWANSTQNLCGTCAPHTRTWYEGTSPGYLFVQAKATPTDSSS